MRRFPSSWSTVLAQLGFKRKRPAKVSRDFRGRRPRIEQLESRQMLTVDGLGLAGYWSLDATSGSTVEDATTPSYDGTLIDGAWDPTSGVIAGSLALDGTNDYVDISLAGRTIIGDQDFAISGWVKATGEAGKQQAVIGVNTSVGNNRWLLFIGKADDSSNNNRLRIHDKGSGGFQTAAPVAFGDGTWHHFVASRKGGRVDLYVDGVYQMDYQSSASFTSSDTWSIGQENDPAGESDFLNGSVDEFRVYSRALSSEEITQLANARFNPGESLVVSTLDDENDGNYGPGDLSLREALALAETLPGPDTITFDTTLFADGPKEITLADQDADDIADQLLIASDVTITGPGAELLAISGNDETRVISVLANNVVEISRLTVTEGKIGEHGRGAGVYSKGDLTLREVVVEKNIAPVFASGGGISTLGGSLLLIDSTVQDNKGRFGGGVFAAGSDVQIVNSTLQRNIASYSGGGLSVSHGGQLEISDTLFYLNEADFGGGLSYVDNPINSSVDIKNSTFSGNTARATGGLYIKSPSTVITNSTITNNESTGGLRGAVWINGPGGGTIYNSIIAGNTPVSSGQFWGIANPASSNNIIGLGSNGDLVDNRPGNNFNASLPVNYIGVADAGLLPLGDYGGPTLTHALAPNSPAIDTGSDAAAVAAGLTTDSRGFVRSVDDPNTPNGPGGTTDIGAFEYSTALVVNTLKDIGIDSGKLSLRQALALAETLPGPDTIRFDTTLFADGPKEITLTDQDADGIADELFIDSDVTIVGPGAHLLTLSGDNQTRVIRADQDTEVTIENLRIAKGSTMSHGGGIYSKADLTLNYVVVVDSSSDQDGGGVYSTIGDLKIFASTLARNTANMGGGLYRKPSGTETTRIEASSFFDNAADAIHGANDGRGGGMQLVSGGTGQVEILNSTFSGNTASKGGGIDLLDYNGGHLILIVNSTITDNKAVPNNQAKFNHVTGGGIEAQYSNIKLMMHNSVVANNFSTATSRTNLHFNINGGFLSGSSNNLIQTNQQGGATGGLTNGVDGNIILQPNESAGLLPLGDYGGPTLTHALDPNSPAIDTGDNTAANAAGLTTDGRGFVRSVDDPNTPNGPGGTTDIGAFEYSTALVVNTLNDIGIDSGKLSLRQAIALAETLPGPDTITFDTTLFADGPKEITLTDQDADGTADELFIDSDVTITGPGAELLAISGNDETRVIEVTADANVNLSGLSIIEGSADQGAGIRNYGILAIADSVIRDNNATSVGGGIYVNGGSLRVERSSISNNEAGFYGGAIAADGTSSSTVDLVNTTVASNTANYVGGLAFINVASTKIHNSTISSNVSTLGYGGLYFAISAPQTAEIVNSTIAFNTSSAGIAGVHIYDPSNFTAPSDPNISSSVKFTNTIIAHNTAVDSSGQETPADVFGNFDPTSSHNIIGLGYDGNLVDNRPGNNFNSSLPVNPSLPVNYVGVADAGLLPLGDYGGPTLTHALAPNSPAIDAGNDDAANAAGLTADGRGDGYRRNLALSTDIGAYEANVIHRNNTVLEVYGTDLEDRISAAGGKITIDTLPDWKYSFDENSISQITIHGYGGNDVIFGSPFDENLYGDDGDDRIFSGGGDDTQYGGKGNDILTSSNAGGTLLGGEGNDTLIGADGVDILLGEAGNDRLLGGGGNDYLLGNEGNDWLDGGSGLSDALYGGGDDDIYVFNEQSALQVTLIDIGGVDTVDTSAAGIAATLDLQQALDTTNWVVFAPIGDSPRRLDIQTGTEIENIDGTNFNDILRGNTRANKISGGDGADVLSGGGGDDLLRGGRGDDRYEIDDAAATTIDIRDIAGNDQIDLSEIAEANRLDLDLQSLDGPPAFVFGESDRVTLLSSGLENIEVIPEVIASGNGTNAPPVFSPIVPETITASQLPLTIGATDPESDDLSFQLMQGAPAGVTIDAETGLLNWSTNQPASGVYQVGIRVSDGIASVTKRIEIDFGEDNNAPSITLSAASPEVNEEQLLEVTLTATDSDGGVLFFSADFDAPVGVAIISLSATTARLEWTPTADQVGTHTFYVHVTDDGNPPLRDSQLITVTVREVNSVPVVVDTLRLAYNTGDPNDNITADLTLLGEVTNDGSVELIEIEVDYSYSGTFDADEVFQITPLEVDETRGTFVINPNAASVADLLGASTIIAVRAREWKVDPLTSDGAYHYSTNVRQITVTPDSNAHNEPTFTTSLGGRFGNGSYDNGVYLATVQPTINGIVTNDGSVEDLTVKFYNASPNITPGAVPIYSTTTDANGEFEYTPVGLSSQHTIYVVVEERSPLVKLSDSPKQSIENSVSFEIHELEAPTIGLNNNPTTSISAINGSISDAQFGNVAGVTIEFKHRLDNDSNSETIRGVAVTDAEGNFEYLPVGLANASSMDIVAHAVLWDDYKKTVVTGDPFTFTYDSATNTPPVLGNLSLRRAADWNLPKSAITLNCE